MQQYFTIVFSLLVVKVMSAFRMVFRSSIKLKKKHALCVAGFCFQTSCLKIPELGNTDGERRK